MSDQRIKGTDRDLLTWVEKYYPPDARKARIEVASEYNDETYDNTVCYIAVLDAEGNELAPLPGMESESRKSLRARELHYMNPSDESLEDYYVLLGGE